MRSLILNRNRYFMIGITTGIVFSLVVMPFLEHCNTSSNDWYSSIIINDYNPVIHLNFKPKNESENYGKEQKRVFRPRFYSTELDIKPNILLCVLLSTNDANFSEQINKTLSKIGDKVIYFMDSTSTNNERDHSVIHLIDSIIYLPKPTENKEVPNFFNILNYLFNSKIDYINSYNFVFMITDRTYVNEVQLEKFLLNFSVSQHIFCSPIISDDNINFDSNFDDILDAGVLFSSTLLLKCNLNIHCIKQYRNRFLSPSQLTYISYRLELLENSNNGGLILNDDLFYRSLTTFPVTNINTHYQLHIVWCQNTIKLLLEQLKHIEYEIMETVSDNLQISWPIGIDAPHKPANRFDVIRWLYLNESHSFMPNDFDVIVSLNSNEIQEVESIKCECIGWLQHKYQNHVISAHTVKLVNFYKKFDAIRGLEYIVDLRIPVFTETKRLQLIKPLNKIELIPDVPYVTEIGRIVLVLPIRSEYEIESGKTFLLQYANVCLKKANHQTVLILILINNSYNNDDQFKSIKEKASQLQSIYKNSGAKIAWIAINSVNNKVASELAYIDLLSRKLSSGLSDSLILHCRANMILSIEFLNRVRLNTILGYQVFFPIPFVEYRLRSQVKPLKNFNVHKDNGYFDITNSNHGSFYLSDYLKARSLLQDSLPLVKSETYLTKSIYYDTDIDLFHLFLLYNQNNSKKLFIMRAIEPDLKLKHESFAYNCYRYESNKYALENCEKRNLIGLGSKQQLAALIIDDDG